MFGILLLGFLVAVTVIVFLLRFVATRVRRRRVSAQARIQRLIDESRTSQEALARLETFVASAVARALRRRLATDIRPGVSDHFCASMCIAFFANRNRLRKIETLEDLFRRFASFLRAELNKDLRRRAYEHN